MAGLAGAAPIADFDGDGFADPSVFQPLNGNWAMRLSAGFYNSAVWIDFLGSNGFVSAVADYDGDGKADPAVYQPNTGSWIIRMSARHYDCLLLNSFLGGQGWQTATADYDGDRKADPAICLPAALPAASPLAGLAGTWIMCFSADGYRSLTIDAFLSGSNCVPAAADYDGDGKADPAVCNPATGAWLVRFSSSGYALFAFVLAPGLPGYAPKPDDYDGDGKADPALFQFATGNWVFMLSSLKYRRSEINGFLGQATCGTAPASPGMQPDPKRRAEQLTSLFENGTIVIQYGSAEILDDGRGITCGRAGFTTATGDALEVVVRYTARASGNILAPYLPELRRLAEERSDNTDNLDGFMTAWAQAAQDPLFRAVQDEVVNEWYYQPAMRHAVAYELHTALAMAVLYDTIIQHGDGEDLDGLPALLQRTPRNGTYERDWVIAFLRTRRADLANAHDPSTREAWAQTVGRVDVLSAIAATGNYDLNGPIKVNTAGFEATIP